jgi:hypothetical protein
VTTRYLRKSKQEEVQPNDKSLSMATKREIAKTLGPAVKPVAKAIVKAGLRVYDAAEERVTEASERLMDLVAEVRKEMNGAVKRKANPKKTTSPRRRPKK